MSLHNEIAKAEKAASTGQYDSPELAPLPRGVVAGTGPTRPSLIERLRLADNDTCDKANAAIEQVLAAYQRAIQLAGELGVSLDQLQPIEAGKPEPGHEPEPPRGVLHEVTTMTHHHGDRFYDIRLTAERIERILSIVLKEL